MPVQCSKCGEEVLGAANRCWRCGQPFAASSGDSTQPPIRRSPPSLDTEETFVAELADQEDRSSNSTTTAAFSGSIRRGSPFADRGTATTHQVAEDLATGTLELQPRQPRYPMHGAAAVGALIAFPMGLISLAAAFLFPFGGLIFAVVGITLGIWGLSSRRRSAALIGILLCCISLAGSGFNAAIDVYEQTYGLKPWENNAPVVP